MLSPRPAVLRRIAETLDASPARIPVLVGASGCGRTALLAQLADRLGPGAAYYVDVERTATTPERFRQTIVGSSPFPPAGVSADGPRESFTQTVEFFDRTRASGGARATFLLDEFLELRTFESFPGLRHVLDEFVDSLAESDNRFVLTSRYTHRTLALLAPRSARFEVIPVPPMTAEEVAGMLGASAPGADDTYAAHAVAALADGRPAYARAIADELRLMALGGGGGDPVTALAALFVAGGRLTKECGFAYELRLHRARGYGALKAILDILADEENLTLTEISHRLHRTPGSTKDYLSWLEDVDLVIFRQKRYTYADPLLRVWTRLHARVAPPADDEVAREIHQYALPRLPPTLTAPPRVAPSSGDEDRRDWGIIEID